MDVRSCGEQGPPAERHTCVRKILIDHLAKTCSDQREVVWRVLHLRLRSAQQGFAPAPVQHTG